MNGCYQPEFSACMNFFNAMVIQKFASVSAIKMFKLTIIIKAINTVINEETIAKYVGEYTVYRLCFNQEVW